MSVNSQKSHNKNYLALYTSLFLFLFAVYLLTYTPRINSSDGLAMFATAESLVRRGTLDIEQIRWMDLQQGTYGLDGLLYSRKGIGVPAGLLPLTWLGLVVPWFGMVSVSLLFNAIVTALTAVILMAYLEKLGFHQRTGLIAALTFGLATLAWPYAKSLFSDPLAGLLLLSAAYVLLKWHYEIKSVSPAPLPPRTPAGWWHLRYPFFAGLFLSWNVATRYAEALFLPIYGLLLFYYLFKICDLRLTIYNLKKFIIHHSSFIICSIVAFCTPILIIGLGLIAFNLSRYGNAFNTGYLPNETFSAIWWEGILGQLVSPGRGLLLYSPILILSFLGIVPFFRRHTAETILALSIILVHLLLYGKWFMWHGGYAWGPRFLIPTMPFWCLFLAPVIAVSDFRLMARNPKSKIVNHKSKLLGSIFILLFSLSLIPQLLAVIIDFTPFQNSLLDTGLPLFDRRTFFNLQYAALISAWGFISLDVLDLAWIWQGKINVWLLTILLANILITGFYLIKNVKGANSNNTAETHSQFKLHNSKFTITNLLPFFSTVIAAIALLAYTHTLPAQSLKVAINVLNKAAHPTDVIITNDPEIAMPFAELFKERTPVLGLNNGGFPLPDDVKNRLNETIARHGQVWWLPNWLPPEESGIEQALLAQGFRASEENFDGQRLVLFATPSQLPAQTVNQLFNGRIALDSIAILSNSTSGTALPVELRWQAKTPLTEDYHIFIHLTDETGQVMAQADGQPVLWSRPTSGWAVGESIVDRYGLWIPAEAAPGTYQLLVGLYRPADGQRLQLSTGADSVRVEVVIE